MRGLIAAALLLVATPALAQQGGPPPEVVAACTKPGALEPDRDCMKQAAAAYLAGQTIQGQPPPFVGPSPQVATYGYSSTRCDGVGNEQDQFGAENWVMGYWSGLNDELAAWTHASSIVGHSAGDGAPILAEVAAWCHAHPANTIKDAAVAVFTEYRLKGG